MTAPTQLYKAGYHDLISVIPPGAPLSPTSTIAAESRGKVPGRRLSDGLWAGFAWRTHETTFSDVQRWETDGANIGLRARRFPGLDIDSSDDALALRVQELAFGVLGPAPVRVGKPPKRLLMYRCDVPFSRMRMWLEDGNRQKHLIELLGDGQQYVVFGTHPGTLRAYEWSESDLRSASDLTPITREQVAALFDEVGSEFEMLGFKQHREGDGLKHERTPAADQDSLLAPNIDELRKAVALIPNAGEKWESRDRYIAMGFAIRAAAGTEIEDGLEIFWEWCQRWDGKGNARETVEADWGSMNPPFSIGWGWVASLAREHGYNDAPHEFPAEGTVPETSRLKQVEYSDRWLADEVIERIGHRLRYAPGLRGWFAWDGQRWSRDEMDVARAEIRELLHEFACALITRDWKAADLARSIESAARLNNVMAVMGVDRRVAVPMSALDADPWLLNTPSGVVDLRSGRLNPHAPVLLLTKMTRVKVDRQMECPRWNSFLNEATGGNPELVAYLRRVAGYCLTGIT